jgi:hypothetical protein
MTTAEELRSLAAWYREFAERAGSSVIWDARLRTADDLEAEAERLEASAARAVQQADAPLQDGHRP